MPIRDRYEQYRKIYGPPPRDREEDGAEPRRGHDPVNQFEHERGGAGGRVIDGRYAMERERGAMQRGFEPARAAYERGYQHGYEHGRYVSGGHERHPGRSPEERAYGDAPGWRGEAQGYGGYGRDERYAETYRGGRYEPSGIDDEEHEREMRTRRRRH